MSRRRLSHRLEYAAYRVLSRALLLLPESLALWGAGVLGWFAGSVLRIRRKDVDANLALAFPEETGSWRRRVARACYVHLGREMATPILMAGLSKDEVRERTEVVGLEAVQDALAEGRGAVILTGHLGNWELGGASLAAHGLPLTGVSKRMANLRFDEDLTAIRERLGIRIVDMSDAPKELLRTLRRGEVAGLVADQNVAGPSGIFVPFFGKLASTARGPAVFALRAGAPLFFGTCHRKPGDPRRFVSRVERVTAEVTGDLDTDVQALTEAHVQVLERAVRAAPEEYFWQHRRWKNRPPEEPPSGAPV